MLGMSINPYAIYVFCDASMDYDSKNTGGIGLVIDFPECVSLDSIIQPIGRYERANIERLELEAIIQGMKLLLEVFQRERERLTSVGQIIFITDRYKLCDSERTNAYKLKAWRANDWKSFENVSIKNTDLLDEVDKLRIKVNGNTHCNIRILYARNKYNRRADKAAGIGKHGGLIKRDIEVKGIKIGKRKYTGSDVDYRRITLGQIINVHIYKKEPVAESWEIFAEICEGELAESKLSIVAESSLESILHRHHKYIICVKEILQHHIRIEDAVEEYIPEKKPPNQAQEPT
jgi:ribonuclease HI